MRTAVAWIVAVALFGGAGFLLSWRRDGEHVLAYVMAAGAFTLLCKSIFERGKRAGASGTNAGYFGFAVLLGLFLLAVLIFDPRPISF